MQEKNMAKADFVTSIGLLLFGTAIVVLSLRMPRFEGLGVNPYSVPGIVPGLLGMILVILSLVLLVRSIQKKGHRLQLNMGTIRNYLTEASTKNFLIALILSLVYGLLALTRVPYPLATGLYVFLFVFIFEYQFKEKVSSQRRAILFQVLEGLLVSAGVTLVFRYLFLVDLP